MIPDPSSRACVQTFRLLAVLFGIWSSQAASAEWQATETVETYSIAGRSGPELYASIGERGPKASLGVRAIAITNFKLTWSRKYEPRAGGCTLATARPKLTITYTLPKPSAALPPPMAQDWKIFIAGVRDHEKVHGDMIKDMVRAIEAVSVGLSVDGDPNCAKIRNELKKRLAQLSLAQQRQSRDFDRLELSEGGAIRRLILGLVNGRKS